MATGEMSWYAVRVRSQHERLVAQALGDKGYEQLLPLRRMRRRWSDRVKEVERPLFPGYLFCRLDPLRRLPVLTTPGVLSIVGVGRVPVPIEMSEFEAVRRIAEGALDAEPVPYLSVGERVRIVRGPLEGIEGVLIGVKPRRRLAVSLTLLQRAIAVEVAEDWACPADEGSDGLRRRAV